MSRNEHAAKILAEREARTSFMKPDLVSSAITLIGPPWNALLSERCRNAARRHMAICAANGDGWTPLDLAIQGLRRINILARSGTNGTLIVPSDQWAKAYD